MHKYEFEVKLFGTIGVEAKSEAAALAKIRGFESEEVNYSDGAGLLLTEVTSDDGSPVLLRVDGVEQDS